MQIFLDLDGVFADWGWGCQNLLGMNDVTIENYHQKDTSVSETYYSAIRKYQSNPNKRFWFDLPLMKDADVLWEFVVKYDPIFLTATGDNDLGAEQQKIDWVYSNYGLRSSIITVKRTVEKCDVAFPTNILIDDQLRALDNWKKNGGIGILHKDAVSTISELERVLTF